MGESGGIIALNQSNFSSVISQHQNLIIDFWAPWCGPCRMLSPIVEELSAVFAGKIQFAKCNTDENQPIAYQLGISAIPTLYFYQNGQVIDTIAGALPRPQLEKHIRDIFQIP
jgi:thioredoxin 1